MTDGSFDAHLEWVRSNYARRRETMLAALERYMPPGIGWNRPQGGFYIWCTLSRALDSEDLLDRAVEKGMVFIPGSVFFSDGRGERFLRLSFVHASSEEIEKGVRHLSAAVREAGENAKGEEPSLSGAGRPVV